MKRSLALALAFSFVSLAAYAKPPPTKSNKVAISILFSGAAGHSETDNAGIRYFVDSGGSSKQIGEESKVYPSAYWGIFPMYFFENLVGVKVGVTNTSKKKLNLVVGTSAHSLNVDGSNGGELTAPTSTNLSVAAGKTSSHDASFIGHAGNGVTSGLDRFTVSVARKSDGKVLLVKEGVFCPPELEEWVDSLP